MRRCRLPTGNTRVWDGGGSTNNWTEAANWVGDVAPQQGDALEFPSSATRLTPFNDFPNESVFDRIRFTGNGPSFQITGNGPSFQITGSNIRLHDGVEISGQPLTSFDTDNLLLQVTCLADQDIVKPMRSGKGTPVNEVPSTRNARLPVFQPCLRSVPHPAALTNPPA
ncbi:MAG: hypothetical protein J0M04_15430 [Verrucomicrobia bacterium]|nr:hypothetical protein [Verrucomicrobiota bacterium]